VNHSRNEEENSSETRIYSGDEIECVWRNTDLKVIDETCLETEGLNIVVDNADSVSEAVSAVIGDELTTT
jgi:ribose 5-phosphate isomerase